MTIRAVHVPRAPEPEKKKEKRDTLETVLMGLNIANQAFGIVGNVTKIQDMKERREIDRERLEFEKTERIQQSAMNIIDDIDDRQFRKKQLAQQKELAVKRLGAEGKRETARRQIAEEKEGRRQRGKDEAAVSKAIAQLGGLGRGAQKEMGGLWSRNRLGNNALMLVQMGRNNPHVRASKQFAAMLATDLASMVSGGSPALQTIQEFMPETLYGTVQQKIQEITGKPQVWLSDAFLRQFEEELLRERDFFANSLEGKFEIIKVTAAEAFDRQPDLMANWDKALGTARDLIYNTAEGQFRKAADVEKLIGAAPGGGKILVRGTDGGQIETDRESAVEELRKRQRTVTAPPAFRTQ